MVHEKPRQRAKVPLEGDGSEKLKNMHVPTPSPPSARELDPQEAYEVQKTGTNETKGGWISVPASAKVRVVLGWQPLMPPKHPLMTRIWLPFHKLMHFSLWDNNLEKV